MIEKSWVQDIFDESLSCKKVQKIYKIISQLDQV